MLVCPHCQMVMCEGESHGVPGEGEITLCRPLPYDVRGELAPNTPSEASESVLRPDRGLGGPDLPGKARGA